MTTNLLQNLIPNTNNYSQQLKTGTQTNLPDTNAEEFTKFFDNAKSKYMSTESQVANNTNDIKKEIKNTVTNSEKTNGTKETIKETLNNTEETNTTTKETEETNTTTKETEETTNTTLEENNNIQTEKETDGTKNSSSTEAETNKKLSENILNNILLGSTMLKNSDEEEQAQITQTAQETDETTNNITDEILQTLTTIQTEDSLQTTTQETEDSIDATELTIKSSKTLATLKQSDTTNNLNYSEDNNFSYEEIENLEDETLIKVEDVIDNSMDEFASEIATETKTTSKISQEIIDELDVTVRTTSNSDMQQKMMSGENNQGSFSGNQQNSAQESIIKMSIEDASAQTSQVEFTEITPNLKDVSNILDNKITNTNIQANISAQAQTKTISDAEILSQINNKLTLPQDNTVNKVNIILQPEQLGKVSVEIMQTKDGIIAKLVADTAQVKDILDKSIESLKSTLASQGVNINNISVKVEESSASQNAGFGFEQEQFNHEATKHSNQERNSENPKRINEQDTTNANTETNTQDEEPEIIENHRNNKTEINENGSISIMV